MDVFEGEGDVRAIAAVTVALFFKAIARGTETVIEDAAGRLMALLPVSLNHITTHPLGKLWAGTGGDHLYVIALEGVPDQTQT